MVKGLSLLFGVGLLALSIGGMLIEESGMWLTWLDGLAGLSTFFLTGSDERSNPARASRVGAYLVMGMGLLLFWIMGLAAKTAPWIAWPNLIFASAFFILAFVSGAREEEDWIESPSEFEYRKSA
jgi:hypothetical protein